MWSGRRPHPGSSVEPSEQLVAAADGEDGGAAGDRFRERGPFGGDVGRDQGLLAVLAAADVVEVDLAGPNVIADADCGHLELVPASRRALREDRDVAAVGVDVQVVRVEVSNPDLHAARSQYGRTKPRSATISRSASMAV